MMVVGDGWGERVGWEVGLGVGYKNIGNPHRMSSMLIDFGLGGDFERKFEGFGGSLRRRIDQRHLYNH